MTTDLDAWVKQNVDKAPPLSNEQRAALAGLLARGTLADLPAPDAATARRLSALLEPDGGAAAIISEPLDIEVRT